MAGKTGARRGKGEGPAAVQAVSRALAILSQFTAQDPALSLADLGKRTGLHRTTVYRLARTLEAEGYLALDSAAGVYKVGPAWAASLCALGTNVILSDILDDDLQRLAESTGETATLSVRRGDQVQIFRVVPSASSYSPVLTSSELVPLNEYWNVHARIHLAHAAESTQKRMLAIPAVRYTEKTVTDPAAMRAGLAKVITEGIAYSHEEHRLGACPMAVPVFSKGSLVAAVGLFVPTERFEEHGERYTRELRVTAAAMGHRLEEGFMRPDPRG